MNPLVTPAHDASSGELGQGTQGTVGGARVVSGRRTVLGGIAPMSPFLALPPAPDAADLEQQCLRDQSATPKAYQGQLSVKNLAAFTRRASNSAMRSETAEKKRRGPSSAAHMIRCYSMPVATQRDYEAQRNAAMQRLESQAAVRSNARWEKDWPAAMSASKSSMNTVGKMEKQQSQSATPRKAKCSPRPAPRIPLHAISLNEDAVKTGHHLEEYNTHDNDQGSGSDEGELVTPRSTSPSDDYFARAIKSLQPALCFDDLIHPDHLQPPPSYLA